MKKAKKKSLVVACFHSYGSQADYYVVDSKEEAVEHSHKFFLSYGFELKDGRPFDAGNDDGRDGGFTVFDNVKMFKGKVLEFTHCEGEGPICEVSRAKHG